jgi:hypothetical protein
LKSTKHAIAIFTHVREQFKSIHLKRLVTYTTEKNKHEDTTELLEEGLFPDLDSAVGEFEALVQW